MESLVNYSSEDEQDDNPRNQKLAERGVRGGGRPNSHSSDDDDSDSENERDRGRGTPEERRRTSGAGAGGNSNGNGARSAYKEEGPGRSRVAPNDNGNRSGRGETRDGKDARDSRYGKEFENGNSKHDYKMNERNRFKDYKSDYRRDRERDSHHRNDRSGRDEDRVARHGSSSSSAQYRGRHSTNSSREDRSRYNSESSHYRYHNHHHRGERSGGRHRGRRSQSRSPSPQQSHKRAPARNDKHHYTRHTTRDSRSRSRSRSRSHSKSHTPTRPQSVEGESTLHPLEQARLLAQKMERKLNNDALIKDKCEKGEQPQPLQQQQPAIPPREALFSLPLRDTAPKQPNVIAVANCTSTTSLFAPNSSEPAVIQLPSYYNPNVINPNKYAEQVQKRKLIWGAKKSEDTAAKWGNAQFSQDSDGKMASKFMRLMGIKSAAANKNEGTAATATAAAVAVATSAGAGGGGMGEGEVEAADESETSKTIATPDVKSREMMFSNMEQQYEVARQATHTMRGAGLGFSSQSRPF